ncbi:uncharacterized protein LOC127252595 [Andrographis paniculata]|uniref:uncharacterized protein LOC127252595 n=1 Tax=Andrographis paniculata TaxID=175694 RepID=UPI0021E7FDD7|nr:uncharacterized protein LOC127252595 [Andrographis paniculata]
MNIGMASVTQVPSGFSMLILSRLHYKPLKLWKSPNPPPRIETRTPRALTLCYMNTSSREPAPATTYAPEPETTLLPGTGNIFETMGSSLDPVEASITETDHSVDGPYRYMQLQYLRKPLWLLGPGLLLLTGVVPTLWLPISSIFLGPNIASLLSLTGLDCVFNLGASLFLLMADSTARSDNSSALSQPPSSYRFWNMAANIAGFLVPLALFFGSRQGFVFLQPQFSFISFAVLLGPYFLLLSVQILTEMLTWHWQSPVWLVTPVVYEAYRLLQLMRGLKLGPEVSAPGWVMHGVRALVCGWVVVLGVQLMRVAWYAGFTARAYQKHPGDAPADG